MRFRKSSRGSLDLVGWVRGGTSEFILERPRYTTKQAAQIMAQDGKLDLLLKMMEDAEKKMEETGGVGCTESDGTPVVEGGGRIAHTLGGEEGERLGKESELNPGRVGEVPAGSAASGAVQGGKQ